MFETRGRTHEEVADFVADITRGTVDLSFPDGLDRFKLEGRSWRFGDVSVNEGYGSGCQYRSDPDRHLKQEMVQLNCLGFGRPNPERGADGRITSLGIRAESDCPRTPVNAIDFFVPFEFVGFDPSRNPESTTLPLGDPIGRVLNTAILDVTRRLPHASVSDGLHMVDTLCALVRDLLLSNRKHANRENLTRARRLAIDSYIEDNLSDNLSAFQLANTFSVSRSSLFRMFEDDGGVEAYILKRRLHRAFHGLRAMKPVKGAVRHIAENMGFFEAANFNRAFRREFGIPPSELVGTGLQSQNASQRPDVQRSP
ncbi:helix-turn-helix transcriptional regulator [Ruegeria meonggei]|uniref:helix-turn-helix transcriptional regulator n=1 Tax=Ruegeria meonggei TaxID=1446476 RepID=UPI00367229FA